MSFFKKATAICLIGVCALTSSAFATNSNEDLTIITKEDDNFIEPYNVTYINNDIAINASYERQFTASAGNGKTLNINIQNNGKNTVYYKIYRNGILQNGEKSVKPGTAPTTQFTSQTGVSGKFKIYAYTKDGSKMNLCVRARQF